MPVPLPGAPPNPTLPISRITPLLYPTKALPKVIVPLLKHPLLIGRGTHYHSAVRGGNEQELLGVYKQSGPFSNPSPTPHPLPPNSALPPILIIHPTPSRRQTKIGLSSKLIMRGLRKLAKRKGPTRTCHSNAVSERFAPITFEGTVFRRTSFGNSAT